MVVAPFYDAFPYAGGESIAENCQILQTRVNRLKANKDEIDISQLKSYSCDIKFTGTLLIFPYLFCFYHLSHYQSLWLLNLAPTVESCELNNSSVLL